MAYIYGREAGPNEKVYSAADYEALEKELEAVKAALAPFAKFEVPTDMRRKKYNVAVYTTTMISGQSTALTVEDFDRARAAVEEKP